MQENWKDVVGFEGYYEVSDLGNVRRKGKSNNLAKVIDKDGYVVHCFCVKAKRTNVMVHQMVNEAFNGPRPTGMLTRHKDSTRSNNVPNNLLWGTPADNSKDMTDQERQARGVKQGLAKLNDQAVREIRACSETEASMAKRYGVSPGTINSVKSGRTWSHVK